MSLGLIVTELVINAVKHAFPDDRTGNILVGYHSEGPDWTLTVGDDGVGMAESAQDTKPGLGTSIVTALARQLHAEITVAAANPGTTVSVMHTEDADLDVGTTARLAEPAFRNSLSPASRARLRGRAERLVSSFRPSQCSVGAFIKAV